MGFLDNLKNKFPWLFGSHYGIERFAVMFGVLALLMCGCVGSIMVKHGNDKKEQLGTQVVYTTAFTMSKSKATGQVVSINVSNDRTKALVLLEDVHGRGGLPDVPDREQPAEDAYGTEMLA